MSIVEVKLRVVGVGVVETDLVTLGVIVEVGDNQGVIVADIEAIEGVKDGVGIVVFSLGI